MLSSDARDDYLRLTQSSGFVVLTDRTIIRLTGKDRLTFLHNFCTADVKTLTPGNATEALILNTKGKLLGHVYLLSAESELLLNTTGGQFDLIHEHLDKYLMREDVQIIDATQELITLFVVGPSSAANMTTVFGSIPGPGEMTTHSIRTSKIEIAQVDLAGMGFLLTVPQDAQHDIEERLIEARIGRCSEDALHVNRIENATPWFGIDSTEANLPQELSRDEQAISFTKGCYLGQETVARIDALGHVNQLLVGLTLDAQAQPGVELTADGKPVGRLTSVGWSPSKDSWVAIGYVKRKFASSNTSLKFDGGVALVS